MVIYIQQNGYIKIIKILILQQMIFLRLEQYVRMDIYLLQNGY